MKALALTVVLYAAKWFAMNALDLVVSIALAVVARALCGLDWLRRGNDDAAEQVLGA